jgi:hypothetical protein
MLLAAWEVLMRGRTPCPLALPCKDQEPLQQIARSDSLPWYQVRRARIVLALAAGQRVQTIARHLDCDQATVWRTRRLYSQLGLAGLLADGRQGRSGRSVRISPPAEGADHRTGLPGADRQGLARHPLGQRRPGTPGGRRRRPPASSTPSAVARSAASCTRLICNRTAPASGRPPG